MHRHPRRPACRDSRGLTLIETLAVVAIGAIVLAQAGAAIEQLRQTRALRGAAALVEADLQHARAAAAARQQPLRLMIGRNGTASCLALHTGPADACQCDSDGRTYCQAGARLLRAQRFTLAEHRVQLQVNGPAANTGLWFDPARGTVTPTTTLRVVSADGRALHQVVNLLGRVRTCSPDGQLSGVASC